MNRKVLNSKLQNFLNSICTDFKNLQEIIDQDMKMSSKGIWLPVVKPDNKYRIIKGFMQSRKTWAIISSALYYLLRYNLTSFIVVQNSLDACEQMMNRIRSIYSKNIEYKFLNCVRGKTVNLKEMEKALTGDRPRIFIIIRNISEVRSVNDMIAKISSPRYISIIDESDFNDSGSVSAINDELTLFKEHSKVIYDVTATPMTSIMKEDIDAGNVIFLSKPDGYKGILEVQCYDLTEPAEYCNSVKDNPFMKDKNLSKYISDFSNTQPYKCHSLWGEKHHPRYSLVRVGSAIKPQLRIANWIQKHYNSKIITITYNGKVTLRGKALPSRSINLGNNQKSTYKNEIHYFNSGIHIGKIIAWLQNDGDVEKYPRIMVLAGTLADRGISFGTIEWADCIRNKLNPWHLTEMYFIAAKSMSQSNLLQAAGRLCGVYPDNIPLSLFTNAGNDIYKAFGLQEELIIRAREARLTRENALAKDIITDLHISTKKCSNRRVTAVQIPCSLYKVNDDFVHGGFDWNTEGFLYDGVEAEFNNGYREENAKIIITDEEREKMRNDVEVRREEAKELNHEGIKICTEDKIKGKISKKIFKTVVDTIHDMGVGIWHRRAKVISKILSNNTENFSEHQLQARLKDFGKKEKYHRDSSEQETDGILFRKQDQDDKQWELRIN